MKKFFYETILDDVIAREKKNLNFVVDTHFHHLMEMTYCFSGKQFVTVGDTTYELNEGDAILIFPYTMHSYPPIPEPPGLHTISTAILCNVNAISKHYPAILTSTPVSPVIRSENVSKDTAIAFSKILETKSWIEKMGWAYIILSNLLEQVELSECKSTMNTNLLVSVIEYINTDFAEQISIKSIAKKFSYSQSYIAHLFSDQLKMPFKTYLNTVRCENAANLLVTTKRSIADIAHESGYLSINTFCRCFKNCFNKSPSQYRNEFSSN